MKNLYYLTINVTNRCNLFCKHCYAASGRSDEKDINLDLIKKAIDEAKELGLVAVLITGGEPLIRNDLEEIFKFIKMKNLKLFLATNSLLLTEGKIKLIKKYIDKVNISLDGLAQVHDEIRGQKGAFNETIKKIKDLQKENISVSVSFTVHDANFSELKSVFEICQGLGLPLNIKRFISAGRGKNTCTNFSNENYQRVTRLVKELNKKGDLMFKDPFFSVNNGGGYGCYAGIHILSIKNNGDVWACTKIERTLGNIKEQSLTDIWNNSPILKQLRDRNNLNGKCGKCHNKNICGGCRAAAYASSGDIFAEDPICSEN